MPPVRIAVEPAMGITIAESTASALIRLVYPVQVFTHPKEDRTVGHRRARLIAPLDRGQGQSGEVYDVHTTPSESGVKQTTR